MEQGRKDSKNRNKGGNVSQEENHSNKGSSEREGGEIVTIEKGVAVDNVNQALLLAASDVTQTGNEIEDEGGSVVIQGTDQDVEMVNNEDIQVERNEGNNDLEPDKKSMHRRNTAKSKNKKLATRHLNLFASGKQCHRKMWNNFFENSTKCNFLVSK